MTNHKKAPPHSDNSQAVRTQKGKKSNPMLTRNQAREKSQEETPQSSTEQKNHPKNLGPFVIFGFHNHDSTNNFLIITLVTNAHESI